MKVVGFSGYSGSGKTTLVERLVGRLSRDGHRVSVVKHAHHDFDIDRPGKDSWRHRQAGAFEIVIASDLRLAKIREYEVPTEPTAHQLIAELLDCDWALIEGFKHADLPKIEVWRSGGAWPVHYPTDRFVVAVCTDRASDLPVETGLPVLDLNAPDRVADFLLQDAKRYEYFAPEPNVAAAAHAR